MQRVAFVLASAGVAAVLALGVGIFDSNVGIAKARKCPPGSTYERPYGPAACTITKVGSPGNDLLVGSTDPRITNKMYGLGGNDLMYGPGATSDGMDGGGGQDILYSGREGDGLFGGSGRDAIYGGPGPDEFREGVGRGGGQDIILMGRGFDYVESFDGERDIISCGPGYDEFYTETIDDVKKDCEAYVAPLNYWWATLMGEGP